VTPAQTTFWRGLRRSNPDLPSTFAPGTYRCPAHDDDSASLSVSYEGYRVLFNCHGPCSGDQVRRRLGVAWSDLRDDGPAYGKREVAHYTYVDERAAALFRVVRFEPKDFRHQHPTEDGWAWGHGGAPYALYRLPKVLEAVRVGERVYVVEGEKDVETLEALGVVATTNAGGAGKQWRTEYAEALRGAYVTAVADRDEAGRKHARNVYAALVDVAAEVALVEPAVNKPHADVTDHLEAGFALDDLAPLDPGSRGARFLARGRSRRRDATSAPSRSCSSPTTSTATWSRSARPWRPTRPTCTSTVTPSGSAWSPAPRPARPRPPQC
jgi:5S rRNA maturation endonuclease (ribonuclease M5)